MTGTEAVVSILTCLLIWAIGAVVIIELVRKYDIITGLVMSLAIFGTLLVALVAVRTIFL